jgi:hypothetical protein
LEDVREIIKNNIIYFIGIAIIATLCVLVLTLTPHLPGPEMLDPAKDKFYFLIAMAIERSGGDATLIILMVFQPTWGNYYNLVTFGLGFIYYIDG